ncbi:hypothetical protein J2W23_006034 [Variovorax boronicumulans]|uniref:hypothetical protein n=1 Tax=Variovorax boronicumulans TaxID=436515 RepID=UPI002785EEF7|nr:hypothetical protein [Variovorax boronicumulans]MDQ0017620.1 hypothetical protein [Variovorax boronicumulans]
MTPRITFIAAACLLAGSAAFAQMPPPPPGGPVPPGPTPIAAAPEAGLATVSGRAQQWLLNPNGEADGLLLSDGTQVAFAPHLSAAAMQMLKAGDAVQVSGWRAPGVPVIRAQTIAANGRSLTDQPPVPGMAPPPPGASGALSAMTAGGRIERLLYTDRGDIRGVMLEDRTIVRFPPHIGAAYGAQLQPGAPLHARGWGTRSAQGAALEATSLGRSAGTEREVFGEPGLEPAPPAGGPRGPRGRGPVPPAPVMPPPAPNPAS